MVNRKNPLGIFTLKTKEGKVSSLVRVRKKYVRTGRRALTKEEKKKKA